MEEIRLLTDSYSRDLAESIYARLEKDKRFSFAEVEETTFACGEIKPHIPITLRHTDVYLVFSMSSPDFNTGMVRLLLTIDAISRADADSLTLVLPFMTYQRQDQKHEGRTPISAKMIANMVEAYPIVKRIQTFDLHNEAEVGFYNISVDNLSGRKLHVKLIEELHEGGRENILIQSPDVGGSKRAMKLARDLGNDVSTGDIIKTRPGANKSKVVDFIGDPKGKDVYICDDMADTSGTMVAAIEASLAKGAKTVTAMVTHGIFSENKGESCAEKFRALGKGVKVFIVDTIPRSKEFYKENADWLRAIRCDGILAQSILETSKRGGSVSKLYW